MQLERVNLRGTLLCCKAASRSLLKAKARGRIVNLTSVVGEQGNSGQTMYAMTKAGIIGLTKSLARELASRGVTVNAVAPGIIDAGMAEATFDRATIERLVPMKRPGTAAEVAALVAFLASDDAAYISGQVVSINGAML